MGGAGVEDWKGEMDGREERKGNASEEEGEGMGASTATFSGTFRFAVLPFCRFSSPLLHKRGSVHHTAIYHTS